MAPLVLDNTAEKLIDEAYKHANGPIQLRTKTERYVVLTAQDYAALESPLTDQEKQSLLRGKDDVQNGNVTEFNDVVTTLGDIYGF